jgi:hypothetical protein
MSSSEQTTKKAIPCDCAVFLGGIDILELLGYMFPKLFKNGDAW